MRRKTGRYRMRAVTIVGVAAVMAVVGLGLDHKPAQGGWLQWWITTWGEFCLGECGSLRPNICCYYPVKPD